MSFRMRLIPAIALLTWTFHPAVGETRDRGQTFEILSRDRHGVPTWVSGSLGTLPKGATGEAAAGFVTQLVRQHHDATGSETLRPTRVRVDEEGRLHVRLQQYVGGRPVVGAEMVLHADNKTGEVEAVNGNFVPDRGLPRKPALSAEKALETASFEALIEYGEAIDAPVLTYVLGADERPYLAWSATIRSFDGEAERLERLFADALTGRMVALHPLTYHAKNRQTYNANGSTSLPGTLVISEGGSSADTVVQTAHNHAGTTWDYYWFRFGRDSYNGSGAQIRTTVRYGVNVNNARWTNNQMWFGTGDGTAFTHLGNALDIVAHEFTHGVTQSESNLTYANESGALNEALSDMAGAGAEAYAASGVTANTWLIGEAVATPGTAGDALRFMNDPTDDGSSRDWYPERVPSTSTPNDGNDHGGVHSNSGIANLAFYLLAQGGTHPRSKTTINVPGIGIQKAELIFYRANRDYLTSSSGFVAARNATASFAASNWGAGSTEANAVQSAWCAVGVPGCLSAYMSLSPDTVFHCTPGTATATMNHSLAGGCTGSCSYTWRVQYWYSGSPSGYYSWGTTQSINIGLDEWTENVDIEGTVTCNTNCGQLAFADFRSIMGPAFPFLCGGGFGR